MGVVAARLYAPRRSVVRVGLARGALWALCALSLLPGSGKSTTLNVDGEG